MSSDDVVYGWSITIFSAVFLVLYSPLLLIFFVDREFRKSTAYVIMTHIAVTDVLQLAIHLYSGILVILQAQPFHWVDKIFGAILTGLWWSMLTFTLFLNYNRITTILLDHYPVANSNRTNAALFLICYLSFAIPFAMKLFPDNNYLFVMKNLYWGPRADDAPISKSMQLVSKYLILVIVFSSIGTYAAIFAHIGLVTKSRMTRRELRITIQVFLVVLYFLFTFFYWNILPSFCPMEGHIWEYLSMMVWLIMNGIHALIYLIFNKRLRTCFIGLMLHGRMPDSLSSQNNILVHTRIMTKAIPMRSTTDNH